MTEISVGSIRQLWSDVEADVSQARVLEHAAHAVTSGLYARFSEQGVALVRAFVTVPFESLPAGNRDFVHSLAAGAGVAEALKPSTPVLSLIATSGSRREWCDRHESKGHIGIPLVSSAFVDGIPMISRLLRQLGMDLEWIDREDTSIIPRVLGSSTGVFFVPDAATETDRQGRKVIAAQQFVADEAIRSVFGFGGAYFGGAIVVFVVFCRATIERAVAGRFAPIANLFKASTTELAGPTRIFAAD